MYEAFALTRMLPIGEANLFHDCINVSDDALDDDVGVLAFCVVKQFRQGFLCAVAFLNQINVLLGFDNFLRQRVTIA